MRTRLDIRLINCHAGQRDAGADRPFFMRLLNTSCCLGRRWAAAVSSTGGSCISVEAALRSHHQIIVQMGLRSRGRRPPQAPYGAKNARCSRTNSNRKRKGQFMNVTCGKYPGYAQSARRHEVSEKDKYLVEPRDEWIWLRLCAVMAGVVCSQKSPSRNLDQESAEQSGVIAGFTAYPLGPLP